MRFEIKRGISKIKKLIPRDIPERLKLGQTFADGIGE
jgi:hypothetical protein